LLHVVIPTLFPYFFLSAIPTSCYICIVFINNNNSISKNGIVVLTEGIFDISDAENSTGE